MRFRRRSMNLCDIRVRNMAYNGGIGQLKGDVMMKFPWTKPDPLKEEIDRQLEELGDLDPDDDNFETLSKSVERLERARNERKRSIAPEIIIKVVGAIIVTGMIIIFQKEDVLDRQASGQIPRIF